MEEFSFIYTHKMSQDEYLKIHSPFSQITWRKILRRSLSYFVTFLLYFSDYTIIIGIILTILIVIGFIAPRFLKPTTVKQYHDTKYLHDEIKYTLLPDKVIVTSKNFELKLSWEILFGWREKNNYLNLIFTSFPDINIPISELKKQKVKTVVYSTIKKYAKRVK